MTVYTIGYGGRTTADLLALLRPHSIRTIVDVRLRPDRASMGLWTKAKSADKGIEKLLGNAGIGYRSLVELGNIFLDLPEWMESYRQLLESAGELLVARLLQVPGPICLLCAEKRVAECHRGCIADYLARAHRAEVVHLE
jgi:uncharacterized protein (DUF488 family)